MSKEIWVLTREHNDYDQHGEYFCGVWLHFPSFDEVNKVEMMTSYEYEHLCNNGGGRIGNEDVWYYIRNEA